MEEVNFQGRTTPIRQPRLEDYPQKDPLARYFKFGEDVGRTERSLHSRITFAESYYSGFAHKQRRTCHAICWQWRSQVDFHSPGHGLRSKDFTY